MKCSNCGFVEFMKNYKFNKKYKANKALFILCGRNTCDTSKMKIPNSYIKELMWLGSWSIVRDITVDEGKHFKIARVLRNLGEEKCTKQ